MDPKAGDRQAKAIEKDGLSGQSAGGETGNFPNGRRPQGTKTLFSALSGDSGAGGTDIDIGDFQLGRLGGASAGVVEE